MDARIQQEIDRARRHSWPLTAIVIEAPHAEQTERALRVSLRTYDLVQRVGRNEMICVAAPMTEDVARRRLIQISLEHDTRFSAGVTEIRGPETAEELIGRARRDLERRSTTSSQDGDPEDEGPRLRRIWPPAERNGDD